MIWFLGIIPRLQKERASINTLLQEVNWLSSANWGFEENEFKHRFATFKLGIRFSQLDCFIHLFSQRPHLPSNQERKGNIGQLINMAMTTSFVLNGVQTHGEEDITGADVIRSAYKLLFLECTSSAIETPKVIPSRHKLDFGQEIRGSNFRFILNSAARNYLKEMKTGSTGIVEFGPDIF